MQREERKIIKGFAAEGKIKPYGMNSVIHAIRTAKTMGQNWQQGLMIANAATAAAIRKHYKGSAGTAARTYAGRNRNTG